MARFRDAHRPPGAGDVERRNISRGTGGLPGRRRELVRGGGIRGVRRQEPADDLPLVSRGRARALRRHPDAEQFQRQRAGAGRQPRGLGPFGTYDMAGNVKEWCSNATTGGRRSCSAARGTSRATCSRTTTRKRHSTRAPGVWLPARAIHPRRLRRLCSRQSRVDAARPRRARQRRRSSDDIFEVYRRQYAYDQRR